MPLNLVIKHPHIMIAVVIVVLGVLLFQPLAQGVVLALGFGGLGVRTGMYHVNINA
ncbi:hypothetical protein JVT61DRAFT_10117 [Boletus reticuloceps]|uniref:Uncharacterized protein n=1 Tax=Boletus reticuloceps TaxID=495285 RepID=A0A8I2YUR1_9AGAM|nr:hypothetical protein JVT61DRAFT_10117 [Boletus reticuloceps]